MTDGNSTAESNIETLQPLRKKVKKGKQVVEEKAGRKKKERVRDAIEAVQKAAVVMIPRVDCSYVFLFYLMFHHLFPALPAIPAHDPSGRHVI